MAQLHSHMEGSIPLCSLQRIDNFYFGSLRDLTWDSRFLIYNWFKHKDRTVEDFLDCFKVYCQNRRNILYSEVRLDYFGNLRDVGFSKEFLQEATKIIREEQKMYNTHLGILMSLRRQESLEQLQHDSKKLKDLFERNLILGVDVTGKEIKRPPWELENILNFFSSEQVPFTYHIGEESGTAELRYLLSLYPNRISHGLSICQDTMEILRKYNIHTELCLSSNKYTGRVDDLMNHPGLILFKNECPISINEDDSELFKTSITNEYSVFQKISGASDMDIKNIVANTIKASFYLDKKKLFSYL